MSGDEKKNDIYDTTLYTDYADLPKKTQKNLYSEFLEKNKEEQRLYRTGIFTFIAFAVVIFALMIAAFVVLILIGNGLQFIILLVSACIALACFVIVKLKMDKLKTAHELRFADWLRTEKHVIAELKEKNKK